MDGALKHSDTFNSNAKRLCRIYVSKRRGKPDEADAARTKDQMSILLSEQPFVLIYHIGPYLWDHKDIIKEKKWAEFISSDDFDQKVQEEIKTRGEDSRKGMVDKVVGLVRETLGQSTDEEKEEVGAMILEMLVSFVKYAKHVKQSGDLSGTIKTMLANAGLA